MVNKGQGALEYLILIGAAVLIATVVIYFLTSSAGVQTCQNKRAMWESICRSKPMQDMCQDTVIEGVSNVCIWDSTNNECKLDPNATIPGC